MAGVMNAALLRSLVEPVLVTIFDGKYNQNEEEWSKLFTAEKAENRRWQEDVSLAGFGMASELEEGGVPVYDQGQESYRVRYTHREYALAFSVTQLMVEDGEHISVGSLYSEHLGISMKETKEWVHADIINNAFNAAQKGGDGVPLISSAHPLARGGVASNYFGPVDLSEAALENARSAIRVAVSDSGLRIALKPRKLVVSPSQLANATRITKSDRRSGTADNDLNFVSGLFPEGILEYTRLTNNNMWFVMTDAPRGLRHLWRRKLKRRTETDFSTSNIRFVASERYSAYWTDWRGVWGSDAN